ncbi:MAG: OadG family protein [Bacteroidales bacterium]|nr:OadG family protein [Bacteroidales bacterium]
MKTIYKLLFAGLLCFSTLTAMAVPDNEDVIADSTPELCGHRQDHPMCPGMKPVEFQSVKICRMQDAFVAIDSAECSVHLVKTVGNKLDTVAVFQTDNILKRHDLKNILRPVSVTCMGDYFIVLVSAVNDSTMVVEKGKPKQKGGSYVALLDKNFEEVARRAFGSPMYAMNLDPGKLTVVGRNPYGYDINIIPMDKPEEGCTFKAFANDSVASIHYRVAKQSEKIKGSDHVGIGLTAVAVAVVFLALVCIALILQGSGKLMSGMDEKKKGKKEDKKPIGAIASASQDDEVMAAIAAAIHLYNDELHDEEDAVITIQKVEREWTPWNAKYYNMNQYFNNRR